MPESHGEPQAVAILQDVNRTYLMGTTEVHALDSISFEFSAGEYWSIMGSSGSGKSTLLNILGCIDRPSAGTYSLAGKVVGQLDDDELSTLRGNALGFVFQSYNLIPQLNVLENILVPVLYLDDVPADATERGRVLAERVGLADRLEHRPTELSGGQQQGVAIARALINDPALILADEATGNLDTVTATEILDLFDELHAEGKTILMVTHEAQIGERTEHTMRLKDGRIDDVRKNGA